MRVIAHGVRYVGAGEMQRRTCQRCYFECALTRPSVGAVGYIQVQLDYAMGQIEERSRLPVEMVEKPKPRASQQERKRDDEKRRTTWRSQRRRDGEVQEEGLRRG